ncbi:Cfr10I/Bse634I family restriction endonuclease [Geomonas subterranea]|uniref:Cfr10I/Bse634I family restriction endonuclease n=1 Tax=Geomonas subterranea TaxID=2847989 RepID=UPI001CD8135A|nr:Cfr10I/Bse634I family restriction endonuclease [Geomonas fuzhouensis]
MPLLLRKGTRYQIDKKAAFSRMYSMMPRKKGSIKKVIAELDEELRKECPGVTGGALSNSHGDWYEWFIAMAAWDYAIKNKNSHLMLKLPNVSQFDCSRLYIKELQNFIVDLRNKVEKSAGVKLISSNPDFVLINRRSVKIPEGLMKRISKDTKDNIALVDGAYKDFIEKCDFEDIVGYVSVKVSFRPDRRLQIPHEGSLMKAIYTHLQTRKWVICPPGLRYYAIAAEVGGADRKALKTVATHSITTVSSVPQPAVDDVFVIDSIEDCNKVFKTILRPVPYGMQAVTGN